MLAVASALAAFGCFMAVEAAERPLILSADNPVRDLSDYIYFLRDPGREFSLDDIRTQKIADFALLETQEANFGYTSDAIWLRISVVSASDQPIERILLFNTNFMNPLDAYFETSGRVESLISLDIDTPFSARSVQYPNMAARFTTPPGAEGVIWIRYGSGGDTALPISIETDESFVEKSILKAARSFSFYAVIAACLIVSALCFIFRRESVFLYYGAYAVITLIFVAHRDGYAFQYLWPNAPGFNNIASFPLGCAFPFIAAQFSRSFLKTKTQHPVLDKWLIGVMVCSVLMLGTIFVVPENQAKLFAYFWATICFVVFFVIGFSVWRQQRDQSLFYTIGWFVTLLFSAFVTYMNAVDFSLPRDIMLDSFRAAMVFDAFMMGFAILHGIRLIGEERDTAVREKVTTLENNLTLHERLNRLESRYHRATKTAEQRGRILADATHDIRQPLFSLRASVENIGKNSGRRAADVDEVRKSLAYLEGLVDEYLEAALAAPGGDAEACSGVGVSTPAAMILTAMEQMFAAEAEEKGLRFSVVQSASEIPADAMALQRIMSNFVSNAVRYTQTGGICVGCRKVGGVPRLCVYDTGDGLTPEALENVMQRSTRGENVDAENQGKGLGLSIASDLAQRNGLSIIVDSVEGRGSMFGVEKKARLIGCNGARNRGSRREYGVITP